MRQEFVAHGDLEELAINLATFARVNSGNLHIRVEKNVEGEWRELTSAAFAKDTLIDNAYTAMRFSPPLKTGRDSQVAVVVSAEGDESNAVAWWMTPAWSRADATLFVNGVPREGTAHFRVNYAPRSGRLGGRLFKRAASHVTAYSGALGYTTLILSGLTIVLGFFALLVIPPSDP